jgi:hypothetical protein
VAHLSFLLLNGVEFIEIEGAAKKPLHQVAGRALRSCLKLGNLEICHTEISCVEPPLAPH